MSLEDSDIEAEDDAGKSSTEIVNKWQSGRRKRKCRKFVNKSHSDNASTNKQNNHDNGDLIEGNERDPQFNQYALSQIDYDGSIQTSSSEYSSESDEDQNIVSDEAPDENYDNDYEAEDFFNESYSEDIGDNIEGSPVPMSDNEVIYICR